MKCFLKICIFVFFILHVIFFLCIYLKTYVQFVCLCVSFVVYCFVNEQRNYDILRCLNEFCIMRACLFHNCAIYLIYTCVLFIHPNESYGYRYTETRRQTKGEIDECFVGCITSEGKGSCCVLALLCVCIVFIGLKKMVLKKHTESVSFTYQTPHSAWNCGVTCPRTMCTFFSYAVLTLC